jgi:hypothetical protein
MRAGQTTRTSLTVVAVAIGLWLFLPEVVGYGWRALRGGTVEHGGWSVAVPGGWFAVERGAALTVSRLPRFPWQRSDVATLVPGRRRAVPRAIWQGAWDMLREQKARQLKAEGYRMEGEQSVKLAEGEIRCADFRDGENGKRRAAVCDAFGYDFLATFEGSASGQSRFYALLAALTPPVAAPAGEGR